ncbi:MAG: threonine ammonia-lyase [Actinomycetota bacterium]
MSGPGDRGATIPAMVGGGLVGLDAIREARARVAAVIRPTPAFGSEHLSRLAGRPVLLKPEHLQRTGSFKVRGAVNAISRLPPGVEVAAASAGNHAQGVALAAALTGHRATVFMPAAAALPKAQATRDYGAEVVRVGEGIEECLAAAAAWAQERGAVLVPPFDHPDVIAGQGTIGVELAEEAPRAHTVVVPVGGGGLVAGVAAALAALRPGVRVVGVEAAGADAVRRSLDAGRLVTLDAVSTIADGIALRCPSELTLAHIRAFVDDVVVVTDEEISQAMLMLLERLKAVVEPAGAAAVAALMAGRVAGTGPAVAVLSGGNVDPLLLARLIEHGLAAAGRFLVLRAVLPDHPGALAALAGALAAMGHNVLSVEHRRPGVHRALGEVEVVVTLETRDPEHRDEVVAALAADGFRVEPLS